MPNVVMIIVVMYCLQEVEKAVLAQNKTRDYSVYSFSSTSLVDILEHFSQSSILRVVVGYVFMVCGAVIV